MRQGGIISMVKFTKKAAAVMMAAALVFSMAACGSSDSADTAETTEETLGEADAEDLEETETEAAEETEAEGTEDDETEAAEEADAAETNGTLRVAMECAYAPYNWTQSDDSNGAVPISGSNDYAYGYDVMMAKIIAEALNMELEIVKSDWDSLIPALQSDKVDCVIAGQSITSERLQTVDFSEPYYYASVVAVTKVDSDYANATGISDLAGGTCTSQQNTIWYDNCLPQIPDANILAAQESAPAMLVALESGRVDYIVTDMPTAKAACIAYSDLMILDFTDTDDDFEVSDEDINIGISIKKGNTELKEKIDAVLATMTVDDYEAMMDEAIQVQPLAQ